MELDSLLQDLKGLIEIPSVTKSGPACDRALAYMLELGTRYGFETKNLDGVCGYIDYGTGDEIFAILCHLDVVPPGEGWTKEPFALTVEGGNAYGRGTLDDKGPAVIALHAMKAAKEAGVVPPYRVRLILGTDEESGDWTGIERYKQTEKLPLYAVTPDGDYPVIHSEKGIVNYEISCASGADFTLQGGSASNMVPATCRYVRGEKSICAAGKAAHGSTPWEGENAITACLAQIDEDYPLINFYKAYMDETGEKLGIAQEDESGALTINAGVMEINETGGKLVLNIRYPKGLAEDVIFDTLCQKAEGLQVERQGINEPLWIDPADEFVQFLLDIYEQEVGERPAPLAIGGGTYARAFPKAASFGVCFPDTPQIMHQADEFIRLADIEKNLAIYTALIKALK